jgi:hypothetical protein
MESNTTSNVGKTSKEINDQLTLEGMLMVVDKKTGKKIDVRSLMGLEDEDVKDQELKQKLR